jgi:hypothetical protein
VKSAWSIAVVLVLSSLVGSARADLVIDSFDNYSASLSASHSGPPATYSQNLPGLTRQGALQWIDNPGGAASLHINPQGSKVLDYSQEPNVESELTLTWKDTAVSAWNLTASGNDRLAIDVLLDNLPLDLNVTLHSGADSDVQAFALPGGIASLQTFYLPLSAFSGVDLTKVDVIDLQIEGVGPAAGANVTLDNFRSTVPEPASWLLLGIAAACGLAVWGRLSTCPRS